jgi:uncharacterized protein YceK
MKSLYCLVITGISLSGCASLETRTDVHAQREVVLYETKPMLVRVATNAAQTSDAPMQCVKLVRTQRSEERVSSYHTKGIVDGLLLSSALMAGGVLLLGISSAIEEPALHGLAKGTSTHNRGDGVAAALGERMVLSGAVVADQTGFVIDQSLLYPPVTDTRVSYREKLVKLDMHVCDPSAAPAVQPVVQSAPRFLSPSSTLTSAEAIGLALTLSRWRVAVRRPRAKSAIHEANSRASSSTARAIPHVLWGYLMNIMVMESGSRRSRVM